MRNVLLLPLLLLAACERPQPAEPANEASPGDAAPPVEPAPAPRPEPQAPAARPIDEDADRVPPGATVPAAFVGRWAETAARCGTPHEMELTIAPGSIRFWESEGVVSDVSSPSPRVAEVTARFTGEGESWTRMQRLTLDESGNRLTVETGSAEVTRVRCR